MAGDGNPGMRTSVNIPEGLLAEFDRVWREQDLENRSRAVREAMEEYVERHSRLAAMDGDVVALVGFDYRHADVIRDLHAVQHTFQDVILNTSHTHQGEWCLESLFCRGPAERVRDLTYRLRDFDAVRRVKVMVIRDEAAEPHGHG
ncbi:putative nickel responsive regulator [Haloarcula amylolytica JCM 13557]|nr:putative nickel responsive regulator [Haloarcula amylolytica JCM 13557]